MEKGRTLFDEMLNETFFVDKKGREVEPPAEPDEVAQLKEDTYSAQAAGDDIEVILHKQAEIYQKKCGTTSPVQEDIDLLKAILHRIEMRNKLFAADIEEELECKKLHEEELQRMRFERL